MAAARRIVVIGATGVFGRLLVGELRARHDVDVVPAARPLVDMNDLESVRRAAAGAFAVACTAGPFQSFDPDVVRAVVREGAHWLDIADDPRWFFGLLDDRDLDREARAQNVVVASGLSTFPAISGALVRRSRAPHPPFGHLLPASGEKGNGITLWIGNRNKKGAASIASALGSDGRAIITPDRELLKRELGIDVETFVEFQIPGVRAMLRLLGASTRLAKLLSIISKPLSLFGSDEAIVRVDNTTEIRGHGQKMAILPLLFALDRCSGKSGCLSPSQLMESEELLNFVEARA